MIQICRKQNFLYSLHNIYNNHNYSNPLDKIYIENGTQWNCFHRIFISFHLLLFKQESFKAANQTAKYSNTFTAKTGLIFRLG